MYDQPLNNIQNQILDELMTAIIDGNKEMTIRKAKEGIEENIYALKILENAMTPAIRKVGEMFNNMELFLPEMIISAKAMEAGIKVLQPYLEATEYSSKGTIVLGTIKGDIHDLGKNIFRTLLEVNGYSVLDLGCDVNPATFVDEAKRMDAQIIGISCLMTTGLPLMREVVEILNETEYRKQCKVVIGGGPTSYNFASKIGADGYGDTAQDGVNLCNQLLGFTVT
jgi:corrinoid protein of di/trimethylamine methyltransferase